jgi:hypothetical protein
MAEETSNQGNIKIEYNTASVGLNMDNTPNQVPKGALTYALNASLENFEGSVVNYQNEQGNEFCVHFPDGYRLIGSYSIYEQSKHIFFLTNPYTGDSEIGFMENNDCVYHTYINAKCLNFNINYPILKSVHKITNCTTEIYWTDGLNSRRYLDLTNPPYTVKPGTDVCDNETIPEIDCNKLKIQPDFSIPQLDVIDIQTGGDLQAGTYQFAIQYCDADGNGYTSYYSVTNPTPIFNARLTTPNFNYQVGRSIILDISNIDVTGYYQYFNVAVIKTINSITSVELVGTYFIDRSQKEITYTGQNVTQIRLTVDDIFEKFPYYDIAQDLTAVQDILVWDNLTAIDRINYQGIANKIELQWQTYKIPDTENYADELNSTNLRGYLRDEVYAFEIVFLLKNGKQTDGFHIPGRALNDYDLSFADVPNSNPDFVGEPDRIDPASGIGYSPYWKIYNTARVLGDAVDVNIGTAIPYKYGEFAYWESTEVYPCNEAVWGQLSNQPIRHHKFPDVLVSPIFETKIFAGSTGMVMGSNAVFPIGVKVNVSDVAALIEQSSLTQEQKDDVVGFKIVRGDRSTNRSIVAKGIIRNVGKYERNENEFYFANYPYNDLQKDPYLLSASNAFTANTAVIGGTEDSCKSFTIFTYENDTRVQYFNCFTGKTATITIAKAGDSVDICSVDLPVVTKGRACMSANTYNRYFINWKGTVSNSGTLRAIFKLYDPRGLSCNSHDRRSATCDSCASGTGLSACCNGSVYETGRFNETTITVVRPIGFTYYVNSIYEPSGCEGSCADFEVILVEQIGYDLCNPVPLEAFKEENSKYRMVFNSPETSFGQPFLGDYLKMESVIFGAGRGHHVEVYKNARYKLLSEQAQRDALDSSDKLAGETDPFNIAVFFAAYQAYLAIYLNGISRRNFAYSFNSIASYNYTADIANGIGIKQRPVDIAQYLIPGVQSVGDDNPINNWNRESSVYIKTVADVRDYIATFYVYTICNNTPANAPFGLSALFSITNPTTLKKETVVIPKGQCLNFDSTTYPQDILLIVPTTITSSDAYAYFGSTTTPPFDHPSNVPSLSPTGIPLVVDSSRYTISEKGNCDFPEREVKIDVVSYYASLKNTFVNQWGQMYSYDTIDTGYQRLTKVDQGLSNTVFGGDTFISRFAFKVKLPFFIDNRVNAPDDSDIFYDEIGNVAYPTYWHSARSITKDYKLNYTNGGGDDVSASMPNIISVKATNFDCPNSQEPQANNPNRMFYDGYFYLFAYGIPSFYCESSINTDLRQAFNNKEGDFWPHVSTDIPDDWLQEDNVTIAQDNTYYYNVSFSKQNKENFFNHLPVDWEEKLCFTYFPFRAIYSDRQQDYVDGSLNNWLIYRPVSYFDFPQNYGKLTSLDGIQNRAVLARFENKSLLYNNLLTIDTSNPQAAYIGNSKLFASAPPIDFAETDLGYVGSQNKMLLKIPQGQITVDAKRGQVFLISGTSAIDISAFGSGMNRFFVEHLAFEILKYFPEVNVDNHLNGIGLHGVYDSKYDRVIISKLDYIPLPNKGVKYDSETREFYVDKSIGEEFTFREVVSVSDSDYFCNKSWTLSYGVNSKSWISFHSYIPNWYIAENNFFYSGINSCCGDSTFEAFAAVVTPPESTTTTSSTQAPATTTTTSTTLNCTIQGVAEVIDCRMIGVAYDTSTPTTTICQRPTFVLAYQFVYGYTPASGPSIISSTSLNDACTAVGAIYESGAAPLIFEVSAESLTVGSTVYFGGYDVTDCEVLGDGWYSSLNGGDIGQVFQVVGGVISSVTTCPNYTTTTTSTTVLASTVFLAYGANGSAACIGSQVLYFVNPSCIPLQLGCIIYTNLSLTTPVSAGFYSNGAYVYECNGSGEIIDVLLCTS